MKKYSPVCFLIATCIAAHAQSTAIEVDSSMNAGNGKALLNKGVAGGNGADSSRCPNTVVVKKTGIPVLKNGWMPKTSSQKIPQNFFQWGRVRRAVQATD